MMAPPPETHDCNPCPFTNCHPSGLPLSKVPQYRRDAQAKCLKSSDRAMALPHSTKHRPLRHGSVLVRRRVEEQRRLRLHTKPADSALLRGFEREQHVMRNPAPASTAIWDSLHPRLRRLAQLRIAMHRTTG
jgi:hypothetical protein